MRHPGQDDLPASSHPTPWTGPRPELVRGVIQPLGLLVVGPQGIAAGEAALAEENVQKWLMHLCAARMRAPSAANGFVFASADEGRHVAGEDVMVAVLAFEPCNHLPWDEVKLWETERGARDQHEYGAWQDLLVDGTVEGRGRGQAAAHLQFDPRSVARRLPHPDRLADSAIWLGPGGSGGGANPAAHGTSSGSSDDAVLGRDLLRQPMERLSNTRHLFAAGRSTESTTATAALLHELPSLLSMIERRGRPASGPNWDPTADAYWFVRSREDLRGARRAKERDTAAGVAAAVERLRNPRSSRALRGSKNVVDAWRADQRKAGRWAPILVPLTDLGTAAPEAGGEVDASWRYISRWLRKPEIADVVMTLRALPTCAWVPSPFLVGWSPGSEHRGFETQQQPFFRVDLPLRGPTVAQEHWVAAMGGVLTERAGWDFVGVAGFAEDEAAFKTDLEAWLADSGLQAAFGAGAPAPVATVTPHGEDDLHGPLFDRAARAAASDLGFPAVGDGDVKAAVLQALEMGRWTQVAIARHYEVAPQTVSDWARRPVGPQPTGQDWRTLLAEIIAKEPTLSVRTARARLASELEDGAAPSRATVGRELKRLRSLR